MVAILDFRSKRIDRVFIYNLPRHFLQVLSQRTFRFRRRSAKQIIKMADMPANLDFKVEKNDFFYLQAALKLPTKFRVYWAFGSEDKAQKRVLRWPPWQPSWISDRNDYRYFWSASCPNISCHVSSQMGFRFRRKRPSWISDRNDFSCLLICKLPLYFLPSFESTALSVQEKDSKIDFQDSGHLGFQIGTILAMINLQVTQMLPTNFESIGPGV